MESLTLLKWLVTFIISVGAVSHVLPIKGQGTDASLNFAYRVKPQDSTGEAPFFLLYGRDARLPMETATSQLLTHYQENLDDYQLVLVAGLSEAWENA